MKYALLLAVFVSSLLIVCGVVVADPRVDAHTMLLLTFNEGAGDIANDSSGNGNDSEIKGVDWVEGKRGNAVELKEDGDCVIMPLSPTLDLIDQFTMEAWIKLSSMDARMDIVSKHEGGGYAMIIDGGFAKHCQHIAGNYIWGGSATPLEVDRWYYIALTYDGESLNVYIDGELDGETPAQGEVSVTPVPLAIGGNSAPGGMVSSFFFKGLIDEFRVSNIARTPDEIREAMNPKSPVYPSGKLAIAWASVKIQL